MCNLFLVGQWYAQCVEWHQREFLTWILGATNASQSTREGLIANQPELEIYILVVEIYFVIWGNTFSWNATYLPFKLFWLVQPMHLNREVEVSSQPKIAPPLQNFLLGRGLFFRFCFPRLVSRNHHSDHLELLQGMHLNGIAAQASDLRSHSAVFPIAKSFHRSSSIPGWCNGCNLTKRPIFWCCWPSRSKIASGAFSRPGTWMELLEPISCASTQARHPSDDSATCPRGLHLNKMPQSLVQPPRPLPRLPLCPSLVFPRVQMSISTRVHQNVKKLSEFQSNLM